MAKPEDEGGKRVKMPLGCWIALLLFIAFCVFMQLYTHGELGDVRRPAVG